jgi:hypothetical protein
MFALSIVDLLGEDDLTGGTVVAGTGTVARDGTIGPVGGVRQKLLGATVSGGDGPAEVFLVPRSNLGDTRGAPVANDVLVVPVDTLDEALGALDELRAGGSRRRRRLGRARLSRPASRGGRSAGGLGSLGPPWTARSAPIRARRRSRASGTREERRGRPRPPSLGHRRAGGLFLLAVGANRFAVLLTDWWWFGERGFRQVFTTVLTSRILLGAVFGLLLAVLIVVNLHIARRLRPFYIPSSPQQAQVQRYREMADPYLPILIAGIAIVFGLTSGLAVSAQWDTFLLWRHGADIGIADPQFNTDIGFYLFRLPFWLLVQTSLFTALVLTGLLSAGAHYLLGGIRPEAEGEKILPKVKAHLAVLLALILAVRAWGYWLGRYELNYSQRGTVTGASYTDVNAELPALYLLIGVSVIAIVLVLVSIRRRGFLLPGAAIALLVVASIILQGAYPAAIQRLRVDPQELARESEFISRNLEATRAAYKLDAVDRYSFGIANDLDEGDVIDNEVTLRNVRLWDPEVLETTYQELQSLRPYYEFNDVSIDRYRIDGDLRQVMIASRSLSGLQESADTWQNRHITFTHGFGVVASQVNTANPEGQPVFIASNIPPAGREEVVPDRGAERLLRRLRDSRSTRWCARRPTSSTSRTRRPRSRSSPSTTATGASRSRASAAGWRSRCASATTTSC